MNIRFSALVLCLAAASAHADNSAVDQKLQDFCSRQAVGVVAELHSQQYPDMNQRELHIARDAAIAGCVDAHTHAPAGAAKRGDTPQAADSGDATKNWFDHFLKGGDVEQDLQQRKKVLGK